MKKVLWISLLLFLPFLSEALQQVSGYISVKYISGYTYRITIVDYTNSSFCDTIDRDTMRLYFGDGNSALLTRSNGTGDSVCECRKLNLYSAIHTFPGPGNYHIWFDAYYRIGNIVNMSNSFIQDMYIYNSLTIPVSGADSLPIITNPPVCSYGCTNDCYSFNLNAYSTGGDSIAYSLGNCLTSGGIIASGYYNPGATINPITGELSWCDPGADGLYNFAILMVTYQISYETIGSNTIRLVQPIDTEEVELQATIQSNCALDIPKINDNAAAINVYPNPNNGIFTVAFTHPELVSSPSTIEVFNVLGAKIYSAVLNSPAGGQSDKNIDMFSQPGGLYLYRVSSQDGSLLGEGKLIIQK